MNRPVINLIAAIGAGNRALGKDNQLLWQIPDDLKRFKHITSGHPVIMGRRTWESLPEKFRPLPGRLNIVVTRQSDYVAHGAEVSASLEAAIETASAEQQRDPQVSSEIFIIGGGELYKEALPLADKLYLTLIHEEKEGDVFFPEYKESFHTETFREDREFNGLTYTWVDLVSA